ncbi:MAG: undecaprenyldiphospho-muramoylpentapeptide beta-N-acetylglucosaminyltransferase [Kofleriaceae bacterium]|nr:undecaprenyldiphospho-muramoylpentapeptide beta-N-acetylglucosaminyltransferase [Myxococcales bacterium]MCB9559364.1 undecaprenyldiphospho-muramoylpentapeptide beta-N-acetylglucosaminyltransferase [Kofleriaceae bacterium]MCB9574048.1 undecaprenyldiphospho-muramoylpentapeptide beta-N-acetylglucosaminyltransferase [Kofleriaceae bacterium]
MRLLIAGGGTGGHLFPGVAVAEELRGRDPTAGVCFVGTERGIEARVLPELGWELALIRVSGLKTVGLWGAVRGALRIPGALWQSRKLLRRVKPDVVLGVGGYASGPVVMAARLMGIPTAICEQNSIPGLTNKILGKLVRAVFVSFAESKRFFKAKKVIESGNPVRRGLLDAFTAAQVAADAAAADPAAPAPGTPAYRVFVCGGSQGATRVNELASEALIAIGQHLPLRIVHQTGAIDQATITARYRDAGLDADCRAFIKDMAAEYLAADVIVSRAGATTVAELAIAGKPAILIPYPFAADNHQELNAREMAEGGAALMYRQADLTASILAESLEQLLNDPDRRARMGSAMKALARPAAAATVVDWCVATAERTKA